MTEGVVRPLAAIAWAITLLLLSGGVASAATRVFTDPNDSHTIDIRKAHVTLGRSLGVAVEHGGRVRSGQRYVFWIDTRRRNPGPEYYAAARPNGAVPTLARVAGFGDRTKTPKSCRLIGGGANPDAPRAVVTFEAAGRCLSDPKRVRIAIHFLNADGSSADWAPAARRFYPRVHRS